MMCLDRSLAVHLVGCLAVRQVGCQPVCHQQVVNGAPCLSPRKKGSSNRTGLNREFCDMIMAGHQTGSQLSHAVQGWLYIVYAYEILPLHIKFTFPQ